jgi:hypothetical protein
MNSVLAVLGFISTIVFVHVFVLLLHKKSYKEISVGDSVSVLNIYTDELETDIVVKIEDDIIFTKSHGSFTFNDFISGVIS